MPGATKADVKEGEFSGVELTFMGLNNQNLHNLLFRGFLKPWEAYTGAKITWIDLAQADYNPRLQQAIATGTVDFDIIEMGAPFEGDVCGKGLASEMPDWVKTQIEMDDYVGYLKPPVGTWDGKTYRISIDGDCHTFNYRTDVFSDAELAKAWKDEGQQGEWAVPKTWQKVQEVTKFLKGKKLSGQDLYGYLDPAKGWGGFGFYFLGSRATAYAKHPDDKAWLFDIDTMKPRVNNPAWVRAIQDVIDALPSEPADQLNADPGTTAFQQFLAGTGSMLAWWGDIGSNAKTSDGSVIGDVCGFDILPGSDDVYNAKTGQWDKLPSGPNYAPNMAYIGWGVYVMARVDSDPKKQKAAWSAAAHLGGKDISLWMAAYPPASSPIATAISTSRNGWRRVMTKPSSPPISIRNPIPTIIRMRRSNRASRASSSITAWPRTNWRRSSPAARRAKGSRQHRRRLGENHRPDRPRKSDRALQGIARPVAASD